MRFHHEPKTPIQRSCRSLAQGVREVIMHKIKNNWTKSPHECGVGSIGSPASVWWKRVTCKRCLKKRKAAGK